MFGGGKVIRESMGQSRATRAEGTPDLVITGAVVLDHWGVVKADVGIRDGRIVALGKAGNPDIVDGVHPALVIGPSTGPASAAIRLLGLDPIAVHAMLAGLAPRADALAADLRGLPAVSAPPLDLFAELHRQSEVRLFES